MTGRTGGKTNEQRDHEQNIGFHPQNARELAVYLLPHFGNLVNEKHGLDILDACSGVDGVLGQAFGRALYGFGEHTVTCIDSVFGHDVFEEKGKYDLIVCNPPWSLKKSLPIYNHLLSLLSPNGILIFVINSVFCYQGSDRAEELKYQKYYFLPRWTFKPSGRPLLDCGVMVYHANGRVPNKAAELRPYIPLKRVDERIAEVI